LFIGLLVISTVCIIIVSIVMEQFLLDSVYK